ncbi:MAG: hypothetical protein RLY31_269 [Bacteroidota bacterium]
MTRIQQAWLTAIMIGLSPCLSGAQTIQLPAGFAAVQLATGLDPVGMALLPDGRLLLVEKYGRVLLVKDGVLQPQPFFELEVDNFSERGLLGIAVDPQFDSQPYVYLYYTVPEEKHNRVVRITVAGDFGIPGSMVTLLDLDELSGPYHNAGAMSFGADGLLYIAAGDGTNASNAQSLSSLLGKILRIQPDGGIPTDNPFYDIAEGKYRAIWSMGHRNPFAMTVQPGTGRIYTTDVGSDKFEEVNEITKGANFGWPSVEGFLDGATPPDNYRDPLYAYDHSEGCAAVGIATYDPVEPVFPPTYHGQLFLTEHCKGKMWAIDPQTGNATLFASNLNTPVGILTAPDGSLYLLDRKGTGTDYATNSGSLWQILYTGSDAPFISLHPRMELTPVGEDVPLQVAALGEAPLTYRWQRDGQDIPGADGPSFVFENPVLADSGSLLRCIVENSLGADTSHAVLLRITSNQRPVPQIISPAAGAHYRAGDILQLTAVATDPEDGPLPAHTARWRVDFHHDSHSHPAFGPVQDGWETYFSIPQITEVAPTVWYRIYLTVTDQHGLSSSITRDVMPELTEIRLHSEPPGFPVYVDNHRYSTPDTILSVVGVYHEIRAPKSHQTTDSLYLFDRWVDGSAEPFRFEAPTDQGLTFRSAYRPARPNGQGEGLRGTYYDRTSSAYYDFEKEQPLLTRIDSLISFDWVYQSPDNQLFGHDNWLVRWEGAIQPFFDERLDFHVYADEGVRLYVDDKKLIDVWYTDPNREHEASIYLLGGVKYPIRIDFFESVALASLRLSWSSDRLERSVVPTSQLFPDYVPDTTVTDAATVQYWPNPVTDVLELQWLQANTSETTLSLYDAAGRLLRNRIFLAGPGYLRASLDMAAFPSGQYLVRIHGADIRQSFWVNKT